MMDSSGSSSNGSCDLRAGDDALTTSPQSEVNPVSSPSVHAERSTRPENNLPLVNTSQLESFSVAQEFRSIAYDTDSETSMDMTPDALDITSDISSDSEFAASVDSDEDRYSFAHTAWSDSSNHGNSSSEDEQEWEESYEWLLDEEFYQPGQASGIVIASPNQLDVSLQILGDAVRNGQHVTRYFIRIDEMSHDDDNGREE